MRPIAVIWSLAALLGASSALAQQPPPLGPQFQVNSYTSSHQERPAVAANPAGGFVVVWQSLGSDGGDTQGWSIQGQRYDAVGAAQGPQFQVNSYTTNGQFLPAVAPSPTGGFVVVWTSYGSADGDTSSSSIQGQRYNAGGVAQGPQFQVNSYTTSDQWGPAVAVNPAGGFVVVWTSYGSDDDDSSGSSIQGQRYDAGGAAQGPQFQINSYTTNDQVLPAVASDPEGGFVVVWASHGSDGGDTSGWSIQGQRYDASGGAQGPQFQVNSFTTSDQWSPAVAADPGGGFVTVWESYGSSGGDNSGWSIQGQRLDAGGAAQGPQFQVNFYTFSHQVVPAVATDAAGGFVVVWQSWGSSGGDTSGWSIQGRRRGAPPFFADGFEDGTTDRWSSAAP